MSDRASEAATPPPEAVPPAAPEPTPPTTRTPRRTFASLSVPNYRLYFFGMLVSNTGLWISRVAQDWLVLTTLTAGSAVALGTVTALQFLPMPLLAPFAGTLTDRFDKRTLLMLTQAASALASVVLAALVLTGAVALWHVYALALIQGSINALDAPTRQAFVSELVPGHLITNAVGLNSATFNSARLLGPGLGGLLIAAFGVGPSFVINAVSFVAVLLALRAMDAGTLVKGPARGGSGGVRAGFAYVRSHPDLMVIMAMVFVMGTFGMNYQVTNALMATQVFGVGPEAYGLLGSALAVGTLSGALLAARRARPRFRYLLVSFVSLAVFAAAAALAPTYWLYTATMIPIGLCALTALTTASASVQLGTEPAVRGRVLALYMAVLMGGTPVGAPIIGWVAEALGPRAALWVGVVALALTALAVLAYYIRRGVVRLQWQRPHLVVTPVVTRTRARNAGGHSEGARG